MTPDMYPHHEDRPDCKDSSGNTVTYHDCEYCGECHFSAVPCPCAVPLCEMALLDAQQIELERQAERRNEEALYGYELPRY